ncbi:hypothetical protein QN277_027781 [Acacia crassicarpa]|uniref:Cupin type-1 domain-containing protein n=1 Tax=Acacia crassicarpa TaxID=499986 RepID=A0AAE1MJ25_9FABA|nr:hypothetical protein QN277_027781 [Acacia crassicarpa]
MKRQRTLLASPFSFLWFFLFLTLPLHGKASSTENVTKEEESPVMGKSEWRRITSSEYGHVSAIDVKDGPRSPFHLQFFTLEPNSLFLPVLLHADMLFYVYSGCGKLTWAFDGDTETINLRQGDIYVLGTGFVFYLQTNSESRTQKLRIFAFFPNTVHNHYDPEIGAYSRINELIGGFNQKITQAAFGVPEELAAIISNKTETPAIVQAVSTKKKEILELGTWILSRVFGGEIATGESSNKNKPRKINVFEKDPDFKNCHGWSLTVNQQNLRSLEQIDFSFLMVNLTAGSMMGPHWNPLATELAMVLEGEGMVRAVCGNSNMEKSKCQNMRFKVKEGDVFMVPRFHPMAQMSFNNDSLVFVGFSTTMRKTYPQFLMGKRSVLRTIDKRILAASFNVSDRAIKQLLQSEEGSIILGCLSCAEEEERIMIEEARKKEEEEARKREEEEARKREEEEARKREEEEARKREEEEARKREEEEAKKREEEEARKREEEEARKREEEEAKKREEAEAKKKEEEEARKREEEEAKKREKEEAKQREEEEAREREKEEEAKRRQEEEAREREEEEEAKGREEEEAKQREKEEEAKRREEEKKREEGEEGPGSEEEEEKSEGFI